MKASGKRRPALYAQAHAAHTQPFSNKPEPHPARETIRPRQVDIRLRRDCVPSPIQTILSAPDFHRIHRTAARTARVTGWRASAPARSPPVGNFTPPRRSLQIYTYCTISESIW